MRCNLANLLRQASRAIPPRRDHGSYAYCLGEVADHIEQVRAGAATLDQFADLYMLRPAEAPAAPQKGLDL